MRTGTARAALATIILAVFATSCASGGGGQASPQPEPPEARYLGALAKATREYNELRVTIQAAYAADGRAAAEGRPRKLAPGAREDLDLAGRGAEAALREAAAALDAWLALPSNSTRTDAELEFAGLATAMRNLRDAWRQYGPPEDGT